MTLQVCYGKPYDPSLRFADPALSPHCQILCAISICDKIRAVFAEYP